MQLPRLPRCGLYDADWTKDVVTLAPGETRTIDALWADHLLQLEEPGRVRLRLHVSWNEGRTTRGTPEHTSRATAMAGVPAFELTSNMVEVVVERRFGLELIPKPRPKGAPASTDLRDLLDVRLTNPTDASQTFVRPHAGALRFEIEGSVASAPLGSWDPRPPKTTLTLAPGASVALLGEASHDPELEDFVDHPVREPVKIRATFHPDSDRPEVRVTSDWAELDLR